MFTACGNEADKLVESIRENRIADARSLIQKSSNPEQIINTIPQNSDNNALQEAVMTDDPDLVALLLENGGDPAIINKRGDSALHLALRNNKMRVLGLMLKNRAVDVEDGQGNSLLLLALQLGNKNLARSLATKKSDLSKPNDQGITPLALLSHPTNIDKELIDFMINMGAVYSRREEFPFHKDYIQDAIRKNDIEQVNYLLTVAEKLRCLPAVKKAITPELIRYYNEKYVGNYPDQTPGISHEMMEFLISQATDFYLNEPTGWTLIHWLTLTEDDQDWVIQQCETIIPRGIGLKWYTRPFSYFNPDGSQVNVQEYFTLTDMSRALQKEKLLKYFQGFKEITDNHRSKEFLVIDRSGMGSYYGAP